MFLLLGTSSKSGSKLKPKIHKSELKFAHVYRKINRRIALILRAAFVDKKTFAQKGTIVIDGGLFFNIN